MKRSFLSLVFCLSLLACQSSNFQDVAAYASSQSLLAKWKLTTFENKKTVPYDSYIEISKNTQSVNLFTINGKGPVNFFWVNCEIDTQNNTLKMGAINGTQIAIKTADEPLENDLLERMAESSTYELSADGQVLVLFNAKKTKSLTFKHN